MLRRLLPLPLALLLAATLVACGDDSSDDGSGGSGSSSAALDNLTIEGEVGSQPEVTFDGEVQADEVRDRGRRRRATARRSPPATAC